MNRRAFTIGLIYSSLVIIFKLILLLGGYALKDFGFYYSHIISVFFLVPFLFLAIYQVREKDRGGIIGGREAVRVALTVLAVSALVLSIYNGIELNWKFRDLSVEYYRSNEYLEILKKQQARYPDKIKDSDFPRIVEEQIASLSAFRSTTAKLFPLMLIGLSSTFVAAVFLKRRPKQA